MSLQATSSQVAEVLSYVKKFTGTRVLIKLGGSVLDDAELIKRLCSDLCLLRAAGIQIVLVHGGSKKIEQTLSAHGIQSHFHEGQRVTTPEMVEVIEMALCGHVNRALVRTLNAVGVAAVGLSGTDDNMLQCRQYSEAHGRVGYIEMVNSAIIEQFLSTQTSFASGTIPVISPMGVDNAGDALNVNADWAASCIATALDIQKLIYLTDQDGIYDEKGNVISVLDAGELSKLIETEVVKDGMLTKVNTILNALNQGIDNIHIISAKIQYALIEELFTDRGIGTVCKAKADAKASLAANRGASHV